MTGEELGSDLVQARVPHFLLHHSIHDILYISTLQKKMHGRQEQCVQVPQHGLHVGGVTVLL